jgi:threonine dehydrogenase-like Zn-dependent dehydrogenase
VRRKDPVPCPACAAGEWDMCRNGQYTERGIKALDGYGAERYRLETDYAVKVDPALGLLGVLLEPATILAKAWDHIDRIGHRTQSWSPRSVLVTGGRHGRADRGVDGLSARPRDPCVQPSRDRPQARAGARSRRHYHVRRLPDDLHPDIIIECTGAPAVIADVMKRATVDGIVCLTGVSRSGHPLPFDFGSFNRNMVLGNVVAFGSVNANKRHYQMGAEALAKADRRWLERLITRKVPLERWQKHSRAGRRTSRWSCNSPRRHEPTDRRLRHDRRLQDRGAGRHGRLDRLAVLAAFRFGRRALPGCWAARATASG